jgi:hypothetical protein
VRSAPGTSPGNMPSTFRRGIQASHSSILCDSDPFQITEVSTEHQRHVVESNHMKRLRERGVCPVLGSLICNAACFTTFHADAQRCVIARVPSLRGGTRSLNTEAWLTAKTDSGQNSCNKARPPAVGSTRRPLTPSPSNR